MSLANRRGFLLQGFNILCGNDWQGGDKVKKILVLLFVFLFAFTVYAQEEAPLFALNHFRPSDPESV